MGSMKIYLILLFLLIPVVCSAHPPPIPTDYNVNGVSSSSSITDNAVVRGDGWSKGVQGSSCSIDDTGLLTCDNITVTAYQRHKQISANSAVLGPTAPSAETYNSVLRCLEFDNDNESAFLQLEVPSDWVGGEDLILEVDWINNDADMAGTNTVKWDLQLRSIAQNEDSDGTLTSATATYTAPGVVSQGTMRHTAITLDYDDANNPIVAEDHLYIEVTRDMGGDSFGGGACISAWEYLYNSNTMPRI